MNTPRLAIATTLLACTGVLTHAANRGTAGRWLGPSRLPALVNGWQGVDGPPLDGDTLRQLHADGIVNRVYVRADGAPVELYVAYYERQRPGVSIHSPLHCLPGTGWDVQSAGTVEIMSPDGVAGQARRLVAQKNRNRALVLYWYAVHGRMVGGELASRLYLLKDRLRLSRNDAALVRIVVASNGNEDMAERRGVMFIRDILPHLSRLWS